MRKHTIYFRFYVEKHNFHLSFYADEYTSPHSGFNADTFYIFANNCSNIFFRVNILATGANNGYN